MYPAGAACVVYTVSQHLQATACASSFVRSSILPGPAPYSVLGRWCVSWKASGRQEGGECSPGRFTARSRHRSSGYAHDPDPAQASPTARPASPSASRFLRERILHVLACSGNRSGHCRRLDGRSTQDGSSSRIAQDLIFPSLLQRRGGFREIYRPSRRPCY